MPSKKFNKITSLNHTDQAIWFLNGFWDEMEGEAETIWEMAHQMIAIYCGEPKTYGLKKWDKKEGNELNMFQSNQFLQKIKEPLTYVEFKKKVDLDNDNAMCLIEYLMYKYNKDVSSVVNSPQGGPDANQIELAKEKFEDARKKLQKAKKAEEEAVKALNILKKEEKQFEDQIKKLEIEANGSSVVKSGIAKNKVAQLKEKPPMQAAQVNAEAKQRASQKASKDAKEHFEQVSKLLKDIKTKGGGTKGAVWWMEREIKEMQQYQPKKNRKFLNNILDSMTN